MHSLPSPIITLANEREKCCPVNVEVTSCAKHGTPLYRVWRPAPRNKSLMLLAAFMTLFVSSMLRAGEIDSPAEPQPSASVSLADPSSLIPLLALLTALSAATQRLVDLVKPLPLVSKLLKPKPTPVDPNLGGAAKADAERNYADAMQSYEHRIQLLATLCGIATAFLAKTPITALAIYQSSQLNDPTWACLLVGILAGSTSSPWNSFSDWLQGLSKSAKAA